MPNTLICCALSLWKAHHIERNGRRGVNPGDARSVPALMSMICRVR
jgi:hypothetical protein